MEVQKVNDGQILTVRRYQTFIKLTESASNLPKLLQNMGFECDVANNKVKISNITKFDVIDRLL